VRSPVFPRNSRFGSIPHPVDNPAAICTPRAPSFLRVGQLELFGPSRPQAQPIRVALNELQIDHESPVKRQLPGRKLIRPGFSDS